jgi:hypothetical protein
MAAGTDLDVGLRAIPARAIRLFSGVVALTVWACLAAQKTVGILAIWVYIDTPITNTEKDAIFRLWRTTRQMTKLRPEPRCSMAVDFRRQ